MEEFELKLLERLDMIVRLLGLKVGEDLSVGKRATLLSSAGLSRQAIADICQTSPAVISVRLAEAKRPTKKHSGTKANPRGAKK